MIRSNRLAPIAAALPLFAVSCVRTHRVTSLAPLAGERVTVETEKGSFQARAERSSNALIWRGEDGRVIPSSDIRAVEDVDHVRGLVDGLAIGAGAGAALGAVGGYLAGDDDGDDLCLVACTAEQKAAFYALAIGLLGGLSGGLLGVSVGSRDRYVLIGQPAVSVAPAPGGGVAGLTWRF